MKKLLLITQNFYPEIGSGANRMKNLFKEFTNEGFDVYVLTSIPSYPNETMYKTSEFYDDDFINNIANDKIIRLNMKNAKQKDGLFHRLLYYIEFMIKVHRFVSLTTKSFDYIYVTSPNIFLPWGAYFFQRKSSSLKILEIRDLWPDSVYAIKKKETKYFKFILNHLEKKMYESADKIVINNFNFAEHIDRITHKKKPMIYIPNSFTEDELNKRNKIEEFSVIYTGNVGYAQNKNHLLTIFKLLNDNKINLTVVLYGVYANEIKNHIKNNKLKYITVLDTMPRAQCLKLVSKHHVSLSILNNDDVFLNVLPGKVIDSICSGTPVVTNLGGEINTMINSNRLGISIEDGDPSEIVNAIISVKNSHILLEEFSNGCIQYSRREFLWKNNIKKLIDFLE